MEICVGDLEEILLGDLVQRYDSDIFIGISAGDIGLGIGDLVRRSEETEI